MSPTETYDEFAIKFPPVWPEDHEWENVHDGRAARVDAISALLDHYIRSAEVVVVVHSNPGIGAVLPRKSAPGYVAEYVLRHEIQVSDPLYKCFVAVSTSGVATGWVAATHKPVPYRFPSDV